MSLPAGWRLIWLAEIPGSDGAPRNNGLLPAERLHYTFNTPVGAMPANQCGRGMFSDFHVNPGADGTGTFPGECRLGRGSPLSAQEKVLELRLRRSAGLR